jgi:hypothetical protein
MNRRSFLGLFGKMAALAAVPTALLRSAPVAARRAAARRLCILYARVVVLDREQFNAACRRSCARRWQRAASAWQGQCVLVGFPRPDEISAANQA